MNPKLNLNDKYKLAHFLATVQGFERTFKANPWRLLPGFLIELLPLALWKWKGILDQAAKWAALKSKVWNGSVKKYF